MQVLKATFSIRRLFASLDIHYNKGLYNEKQKRNETSINKLQTKVVDSMTKVFLIFL